MTLGTNTRTELRALLDAMCEESFDDAQLDRLEQLLAESEEARAFYVEYMSMHASPERYVVGDTLESHDAPMALAISRTSTTQVGGPAARGAGGWLSPLAIAAGVALAAAVALALLLVSPGSSGAGDDIASLPPVAPVPMATLVDASTAEWADLPGTDEAMLTSGAELGVNALHLQSGSAQFILESGAVVTAMGDTRFEIAGANRVFLRQGRIVAHVPERALGFTVDGPGILVVDHGTDFGVHLNETGVAEVHVFQGKVTASLVNDAGVVTQTTPLDAEHGARLTPREFIVRPIAADRRLFAATAKPLPLFNTGRGLTLGKSDQHWVVEGGNVERRNAVVSQNPNYVPNEPDKSQWVSFDPTGTARSGTQMTFTTRFDMTGLQPDSARIHGRFSVDNKVTAIRINGHEIAVPEHPWEWAGFTRFSITEGFKPGVNTLQFVVLNHPVDGNSHPMALRVELAGTAIPAEEDPN